MAEWTKQEWEAKIDRMVRRSDEIASLLRGRSYLSSEELEIIYSRELQVEEKRVLVAAIRERRAVRTAQRKSSNERRHAKCMSFASISLTFEQRLNHADAVRARAWGISLN